MPRVEPTAAPAGNGADAPKVEIVVSVPTVVKAVAIFFALIVAYLVRDALLSIALAVVFILGLDPPVSALERRGWGRGKAALLVFGVIGLALSVIVIWAAKPVWDAVGGFVDDIPGYVDKAQNSGVLQDVDKNTDAFKKLHSAAVDAAKNLPAGAANLLGAAAGVVGTVFSLVTLTFLTLFGLIAKPQLTRAGLELMRPLQASRFERTLGEVCNAVSFSLIGNIVISVIAATVVGVAAAIVGAPSPVVLALIVGLFDLIPQIGSTIAAVIVVTITLIATGPGAAAILLVVILIYQQVENYLIQPAVMRQAVELTGFATIAVVMLGGALLGVVGAVLAVPVAASVKIVVRELTEGRRTRMAALREPAVSEEPALP
ncbi:MAG: AI-2E family transporter [Solirubrobacteraceae bacterium]